MTIAQEGCLAELQDKGVRIRLNSWHRDGGVRPCSLVINIPAEKLEKLIEVFTSYYLRKKSDLEREADRKISDLFVEHFICMKLFQINISSRFMDVYHSPRDSDELDRLDRTLKDNNLKTFGDVISYIHSNYVYGQIGVFDSNNIEMLGRALHSAMLMNIEFDASSLCEALFIPNSSVGEALERRKAGADSFAQFFAEQAR
jgi:hypothetical protein